MKIRQAYVPDSMKKDPEYKSLMQERKSIEGYSFVDILQSIIDVFKETSLSHYSSRGRFAREQEKREEFKKTLI